jgi:NADH:ubiquinone oxidoreductase subunit F (NADH-binding)
MTTGRASRPAPISSAQPEPTRLPRLLATAADPGFDAHVRQWGQMPGGPVLIRDIECAGLCGRGGASFPTWRKLATVASGRRPIVVANGTEGEPASLKDKTLLISAPHLVFDGISIAAETVGAHQAVLCVDRQATKAVQSVRKAAAERAAARADVIDISIETAPPRYLTGEESALVHWLNGGNAKPTFVPPRPFEKGVQGRPTLVNNVETLANLALIARFGPGWFRSLGTPEDPGTLLVTVGGDVPNRGVYEVPFGAPVESLLRSVGAGPSAQAVLTGGYAGTWIPATTAAKLSLDRKSFSSAGAVMGCASLLILGSGSCGLVITARIAGWMAGQSAGQCGPCVNGLPVIADALDGLVAGDRRGRWEKQLPRWLDQVERRGACHHPDGVAQMVRSALKVFSKEIENHRGHGPCRSLPSALPLPNWQGTWR